MYPSYTDSELHIAPVYFGNDAQQTRVIERLEKDAKNHRPKMHMVSGGPASGKSDAIKMMQEGLQSDYEPIAHADDIEAGVVDKRVPKEIATLVKDMTDEKYNMYVQHEVYKAKNPGKNGKDFYVVVADGDLPLTDKRNIPYIQRIADLVENKDKGYDVMWVSDVPIMKQRIPLFKPAGDGIKERAEHNEMRDTIKRTYPKTVVTHELRYDIPEIKRAVWKGCSSQGVKFKEDLKTTLHKPHTQEDAKMWDKVCAAAEGGDKRGFNNAMRVLATNAKSEMALAY